MDAFSLTEQGSLVLGVGVGALVGAVGFGYLGYINQRE